MRKFIFSFLAVASVGISYAQDPMTALAMAGQFGGGDVEVDTLALANKGIGLTIFSGKDNGKPYRIGLRYARYNLNSSERDAYFDGSRFEVSLRELVSSEVRFDLVKQYGGSIFGSFEFGQRKFRVKGDGTSIGLGSPTRAGGTGNSAFDDFSEWFIAPGIGYTFRPAGQQFSVTALATYSMGLDSDRDRSVAGRTITQSKSAVWYSLRVNYRF